MKTIFSSLFFICLFGYSPNILAQDIQITQLLMENTEGELHIKGTENTEINLPKNISTEINGTVITLKNQSSKLILIEIPKYCNIKINNHKGDISVKNFEGKVEVETQEGNIHLEKLSNEVYANTNKGNIKGVFKEIAPKKIISLVNVQGNIDVVLPKNTQANWRIKADAPIKSDFSNMQDTQNKKEYTLQISPEKPTYMLYNKGGKINILAE